MPKLKTKSGVKKRFKLTATGRLYAIPDPAGWYPAFIPDPAGAAVHGMVHAAGPGFAQADLAALDAYEDYRPADPAGSLYLRRQGPE